MNVSKLALSEFFQAVATPPWGWMSVLGLGAKGEGKPTFLHHPWESLHSRVAMQGLSGRLAT